MVPASAMFQNSSGLLLTKATFVLPLLLEQAGTQARTAPINPRDRKWRDFMVRLNEVAAISSKAQLVRMIANAATDSQSVAEEFRRLRRL